MFTLGQLQQWTLKVSSAEEGFVIYFPARPPQWEMQKMSDIFLIILATEESICRGMFLTGFWEYVYMYKWSSTDMFASRNGEARPTSTYTMTLPFHSWNEVEFSATLACEEKKNWLNRMEGQFYWVCKFKKKKSNVCGHISWCGYIDVHLDMAVSYEVCECKCIWSE